MLDESRYTIYQNKDGRTRVYDKVTKKVTSYPRLLMAEKIGRPLMADEDVHHIDGNPLNNNIDNLQIINHQQHDRIHATKYIFEDKEMICPQCGKLFIWTADSQRTRKNNLNRKHRKRYNDNPFCSKKCCGKHNQREQMRQKMQTECA